jgi:hypothetical protein
MEQYLKFLKSKQQQMNQRRIPESSELPSLPFFSPYFFGTFSLHLTQPDIQK